MDFTKALLEKVKILSFLVVTSNCFSQNTTIEIKGNWYPQSSDVSCWAASLSNLTRCVGCKVIDENVFFREHNNSYISANNIENIFEKKIFNKYFNFKVIHDKVLSFNSISNNFKVKTPRPIIYSYSYDNGDGGHFVNIIGTRKIKTESAAHNQWLVIYDPKPDLIGNRYLKSYTSYKLVKENQKRYQGTYFHITGKKTKTRDASEVYEDIQTDKSAISDLISGNTLIEKVAKILENAELKDFIGGKISELYIIQIIKREQVVRLSNNTETQVSTITAELDSSYLFIPICNNKIVGGAIVQRVDSSNFFLIDRILKIEEYGSLMQLIISKRKEIKKIDDINTKTTVYKCENLELLDFGNGKMILNDIQNFIGYDLFQLKKEYKQKSISVNIPTTPASFQLDREILKNWKINNLDNENSFNKILKRN